MKEVVITLSTVDIVTDAYMVVLYYSRGLDIQGNIMVAMLSVNMTIQLFAVIVVYKKKGWRRLLREILLTVCYLRPFVDAHRVNNRETSREGGESEGGQRRATSHNRERSEPQRSTSSWQRRCAKRSAKAAHIF